MYTNVVFQIGHMLQAVDASKQPQSSWNLTVSKRELRFNLVRIIPAVSDLKLFCVCGLKTRGHWHTWPLFFREANLILLIWESQRKPATRVDVAIKHVRDSVAHLKSLTW